ncbi:MAG: hypothetical protein QY323_03805 [Patescibacteria group bacterium]|nr:MAG: hypothetical protein QY323_03805 [Patescibacteria group bacterium]
MQPTTGHAKGSSSALDHSRHRARSGHGRLAGLSSDGIEAREVTEKGRIVRFVREERYNVPVPHGLKGEVRNLFIKRNSAFELDLHGKIYDERALGRVLVIVPHKDAKIARGIVGIPGTNAETKRLRKLGFSHLTIGWIPPDRREEAAGKRPEGYDERAFALNFYHPKSGGRHAGEKDGELVHEIIDELSVLEWIDENGLAELYTSKPLLANGFLPKTDEQRAEENAIAAKTQIAFGRPALQPHPEHAFHRTRLLERYRTLFRANVDLWDEDALAKAEMRAREAFAKSRVGRKSFDELSSGRIAAQDFYVDERRGFAYALFNLPGARYIVAIDAARKGITVSPLAEDVSGLEQIMVAGVQLTLSGCVQVDWPVFSAYARGIGTVLGTSVFSLDHEFN